MKTIDPILNTINPTRAWAASKEQCLLFARQLEGSACIVCFRSDREMVPIGLQTSLSSEIFRCSECVIDLQVAKYWIQVAEEVKAEAEADPLGLRVHRLPILPNQKGDRRRA